MHVADEELASRLEQLGHHCSPVCNAMDPAESADTREYDIELALAQSLRGIVHRRLHVAKLGATAGCCQVSQPACFLDGFARDVQADYAGGAEAGEAERVSADVALQMYNVLLFDIREAGNVKSDNVAYIRRVAGVLVKGVIL